MLFPNELKARYGDPIRPAINPYTETPIPDDVYVKEQYGDIFEVVNYILPLLEPYEFDNSTAAGRLRGELMWLKQEVKAENFPIPGTRDMVATLGYLAFNYSLPDELPDLRQPLRRMASLVVCHGIVKPRNYLRVIELIQDKIEKGEDILRTDEGLSDNEIKNMTGLIVELKNIAKKLFKEDIIFPLKKAEWPFYHDKMTRGDVWDRHDFFYNSESELGGPFMSSWRPRQSQPTPGWVMPDWVKEPMVDKG